jgi:hypothetical protein
LRPCNSPTTRRAMPSVRRGWARYALKRSAIRLFRGSRMHWPRRQNPTSKLNSHRWIILRVRPTLTWICNPSPAVRISNLLSNSRIVSKLAEIPNDRHRMKPTAIGPRVNREMRFAAGRLIATAAPAALGRRPECSTVAGPNVALGLVAARSLASLRPLPALAAFAQSCCSANHPQRRQSQ